MYIFKLNFLITILILLSFNLNSQISNFPKNNISKKELFGYESNIAYKLPFRGNNYKFFGTLRYHFQGKAYTKCNVQNAIVEALYLSEENCPNVNFRIVKCSRHKFGRLTVRKDKKSGFYCYFMTPMVKNDIPLKNYYRTGIFRKFIRYDTKGKLKHNSSVQIDYESMAQFLLNLDFAAQIYGLEIKKIMFNRLLIKELYKSTSGKTLKKKNLYFAKYFSEHINNTYDDIFYVEFKRAQ